MKKFQFTFLLFFLMLGFNTYAQINDPYQSFLKKLMEAEQLADYAKDIGLNPNELYVLDNGIIPSRFQFEADGQKATLASEEDLKSKGVETYMVFKKLKVKGRSMKFKYRFGKLKASGLYKVVDGEIKKFSSIYSIVEL